MDLKFLHFLFNLKLVVYNFSLLLHVIHCVCVCVLAERFGKKLEELCRERGALKLGLPSRQPSVALFLEQLRQVVHSALQRTDCSHCRSVTQQGNFHDPINITVMRNYCVKSCDTFLVYFKFLTYLHKRFASCTHILSFK